MAAGERAGDPAHFPTEAFVKFIGVRKIAIGEKDDDEPDGKSHANNREETRKGTGLLLWTFIRNSVVQTRPSSRGKISNRRLESGGSTNLDAKRLSLDDLTEAKVGSKW